jgi:hypothetical protein
MFIHFFISLLFNIFYFTILSSILVFYFYILSHYILLLFIFYISFPYYMLHTFCLLFYVINYIYNTLIFFN